jgi:CRISPR type IV-associated protein Csf3
MQSMSLRKFKELESYRESIKSILLEPLLISVSTISPVVNVEPIALDSVIAFAVVKHCLKGRGEPSQTQKKPWDIPLPLLLQETIESEYRLPLWASTNFETINPESMQTHYHKRSGDNPYWIRANQSTLNSKKKRRKPSSKAGQYMDYRIPIQTTIADRWYAQCIGNKEEISRLLNTYVTNFGKLAANGYGRVLKWDVAPIDSFSFFDKEGNVLRPIPTKSRTVSDSESSESLLNNVRICGWTPAYWDRMTWMECTV